MDIAGAVSEKRAGKPKPLSLSRTFQAFRYSDFRLMWLGAFTSTTGTWMQMVAQSWLVFSLTGSAFYLGLTGFFGDLPILLFSLVGGVTADRIDRRKQLLTSQYIQMACAFILTVLVYFGWVRIWHILALVFAAGTGQAFGGPAYQALVPGLVKREDVPNAIALNSIQFNLARVVGPLLAAVAMASVGAVLCFFLNGISFIAVIISLYLIQATFKPEKTTESVLAGMGKGFAFVKEQGPLWQLTVLGFASTFCGIPLLTLLPVFARDVFRMGSTGYSTMMAASGAGAITGALLFAGLGHVERRGIFTLRVQLILALFLGIFAVSRVPLLSYVILFLGGVCLMALFASITSLVQLATSEQMRGRVMSIFMLAFRGGMPLGNLTAGFLASRMTPSLALVSVGALLGMVAVGFMLSGSGVKKL
ncbi:MAG TPA: MFS transporter [Acidobacteriota bacterium]|nr:MFS transporter [Acidobacteriota bacterium]